MAWFAAVVHVSTAVTATLPAKRSAAGSFMKSPLLCVLANGDGIVPRETAEFPFQRTGATSKQLLEVGNDAVSIAHADMFVSNEAHARVFAPLAAWLAAQG